MSWGEAMLDAFRLAERLFGDVRRDRLSASVATALDRRGDDTRALARRVAARVRPVPAPARVLAAPPRVRALLGTPGATPRKRYAPPPGLADTLRRVLLVAPPTRGEALRGRGRAVLASIEDDALYERSFARLPAEEAAAVATLRALESARTSTYDLVVRAAFSAGASVEVLGALAAGWDGAEGEGPVRAGRELRAMEATS